VSALCVGACVRVCISKFKRLAKRRTNFALSAFEKFKRRYIISHFPPSCRYANSTLDANAIESIAREANE